MRVCLSCSAPLEVDGWSCAVCGWAARERDGFPDLAGGAGTDGFGEESFALLPDQEDRSFWFRGRNALIAWATRTYAPAAESFLEIGCGTGYVLQGLAQALPAMRLVGGEPYVSGLRTAGSRVPSAELLLLDARRLPFRDEFDAAGAFDVLEHVDDDALVLRNLGAAVRPGGTVLLTVPQHHWLWSPLDEFAHHRRRYTRRRLVSLVRQSGLHVVRATSFVSFLLPAVAASRFRQRGRPINPLTEFGLPGFADRAFEGALRFERVLIEHGVSLPVGSSLLVVARRPSETAPTVAV